MGCSPLSTHHKLHAAAKLNKRQLPLVHTIAATGRSNGLQPIVQNTILSSKLPEKKILTFSLLYLS